MALAGRRGSTELVTVQTARKRYTMGLLTTNKSKGLATRKGNTDRDVHVAGQSDPDTTYVPSSQMSPRKASPSPARIGASDHATPVFCSVLFCCVVLVAESERHASFTRTASMPTHPDLKRIQQRLTLLQPKAGQLRRQCHGGDRYHRPSLGGPVGVAGGSGPVPCHMPVGQPTRRR